MSENNIALKIVKRLLKEGLHITPEALDLLIKTDNPEGALNTLLEKLKEMKELPIVVDVPHLSNIIHPPEKEFPEREEITIEEFSILRQPSWDSFMGTNMNARVNYLKSRYEKLKSIFTQQYEHVSIAEAKKFKKGEVVSLVAMITGVNRENEKVTMMLEDESGAVLAIADLKNMTIFPVPDIVIYVKGEVESPDTIIVKEVNLPPEDFEKRQSLKPPSTVFAVLISDIHVGNPNFAEEQFKKLLRWILHNHKSLNIKYIIIAGDVGEFSPSSPYTPYERFSQLISQIPSEIRIIIIPGDSDSLIPTLPQIPHKFIQKIEKLRNNMHVFGNPTLISLLGVKIFVYHPIGLEKVALSLPGVTRPSQIVEYLIKTRCMAPYLEKVPVLPHKDDIFVLEDVPDVIHLGHLHSADSGRYKNLVYVCSGSWIKNDPGKLPFSPSTCVAHLLNLKTLEVHEITF
ncbi:MAG: metallophosphoesterase [Candidatus Baldrarchaeia archaeon]